MISVYIHLPFCYSICSYCDFCKLYYDKSLVKTYLDALENEIKISYKGEEIKTIYIGGGTPSALDIDELKHLFKILDIFNKKNMVEYTIEANAESLDRDKLLLFKENGINRISIGVQTFNERLLKVLGRKHDKKMIINAIALSKSVGITNINIDLIYGIYDQSLNDLKSDINMFLSLDIPHVSFYSLIIEPHTRLYINSFKELDEDTNALMYQYINDTLESHNYHHYEISNYSKVGYESKHNLVYWHNEQYYGFGLGSSSFIDKRRYENTRSINKYLDGFYMLNEEVLSDRKMMENEMILGLRLLDGVNKNNFYQKYHQKMEDVFPIEQLIARGLIVEQNGMCSIPSERLFISNSILIEFLE
ncbi:MAG: radical SAM family heme chaperone HemW [Bacilli bacterium]|jgi:oxygen-independent coproporphyrinogen-3 oxidase